MARLPAAIANVMITAAWPTATNFYMALFLTDPGTTGVSGEMIGGGYGRQLINLGAPSGGVAVSGGANPAQNFTNIPNAPSGIPYFAVFSALTGGTYQFGGVTSGLTGNIPVGATVAFANGQVSVSIA
jgi:hypothetical protein